jgi:hypothetical protein
MFRKSAFRYQSSARKRAVRNQAKYAARLLRPRVQEKKKNTLNYALKAA